MENTEDDLVGATAEEENEDALLRRISELELVADPGECSEYTTSLTCWNFLELLLGMHSPLMIKVVLDANAPSRSVLEMGRLNTDFPPPYRLRSSAVLCLCKFMCVSEVCSCCKRDKKGAQLMYSIRPYVSVIWQSC